MTMSVPVSEFNVQMLPQERLSQMGPEVNDAGSLRKKEQTPENPDASDEFDMMRAFLQNRSQMDPGLLIPYIGEFIAWSPDGKRIIAHAKDHAMLRKLIREAGENPRHCVVGGFDGDTII